MPDLSFEYTKAVTYTVENMGDGIGQNPATEVTHLRLINLQFFSQWFLLLYATNKQAVCRYSYVFLSIVKTFFNDKINFQRMVFW